MNCSKIAIIGAGAVGSTIAYALILKEIVCNIILIDIDKKRCAGEILDLSDSLFCGSSRVYQGEYSDAAMCDIIIISAGKPQKPGQKRSELLEANRDIIKTIFDNIGVINPNAIIIMVTNPVDIMTYYALKFSHLMPNQVFGTGTSLDTQRLKNKLSTYFEVLPKFISGYVVGKHDDLQVVAWSTVLIGSKKIDDYKIDKKILLNIENQVKNEAYEIIQAKGATYYGIASCVANICQIIVLNKREIIPLSIYHKEYDSCFSIPVILTNKGFEDSIKLILNDSELDALKMSIKKN